MPVLSGGFGRAGGEQERRGDTAAGVPLGRLSLYIRCVGRGQEKEDLFLSQRKDQG